MPITKYCDEHHLTPRQRLELFIPVCQAVQHAHQKGIIHRDLKPSNVLVALYDGKPVPKVIDFGVAKAAGQSLTDKTLVTGFGAIVGTLEYMSPEQAEINQLDIDTRSDIYSLGVLLYELLTGSTPFSKKDLEKAGMLEMLRVIREDEPSKPSTKLSTAEGLPTLAANRGTEPAKLTKLVRGELDWIVMKALEKDRARRYETANGFAMDVQRYLADEAVQACPPSVRYRFRKFARRNKGGLTVAALVAAFIVVLGTGAGWTLRDRAARKQEAALTAARKLALTEEGIRQALNRAENSVGELHAALKKKAGVQGLLNQPARWELFLKTTQTELAQARQLMAGSEGTLDAEIRQAVAELEQQLARDQADYRLAQRLEKIRLDRANWAKVQFDYGASADEYPKAFAGFGVLKQNPEAAAAGLAASPINEQLVAALDDWAWVTYASKRQDLTEQILAVARRAAPDAACGDRLRQMDVWENQKALARLVTEAPTAGMSPQLALMVGYLLEKDHPRQVAWLRQVQAEHPADFWLALELGNALPDSEQAEAAVWFRVALAIRPTNTAAYTNLGYALNALNKFPEAIAALQKAIELDPKHAFAYNGVGVVFDSHRKLTEAVDAYRKAIAIAPNFTVAYCNLGRALGAQRKFDDSAAAYQKAIEVDGRNAPAYVGLGTALRFQHKWDDAVAACRKAIEIDPKYVRGYFSLGEALQQQQKFADAVAAYHQAIELGPNDAVRAGVASGLNGVAWVLATHAEPARRDPVRAVRLANEAIGLNPQEGSFRNTLGAALYRAGRWNDAIAAFDKSMEMCKGGDSSDWFFVAMARWRLGEKDKAREWYDRAVHWMDKNQPKNGELRRFRAEAAELLGLKEKK